MTMMHVYARKNLILSRASFGLAVTMLLALAFTPQGALGQAINLGTADAFAVLAGSGITNTGPTTITGDVGTFPNPAITGFGTVTLNGTNHGADAVTQQAKIDLVTAYNTAAARTPSMTYAPAFDLGGLTLSAGVYKDPTSFGLTGTLTLDAQGNPDAVFVFQTGSTLTTASGAMISLIGGAQACHIFWQIGSSVVLGTNTDFAGNILAFTSITLGLGANVDGRVLAINGAVTLDSNTITLAVCQVIVVPTETLNIPAGQTTINGGTLVFPGNLVLNGPGTLISNGAIIVGNTLDINGASLFVNGVLQAPQTNVNPGSTLGGTGLIVGNVFNGGMVAPGNAPGTNGTGTLNILGNFAQGSGGTLQIGIGSSGFDSLIVSGNAILAGVLQIIPLDGFQLQFGQQFPLFLQAGSISGAFDSIVLPNGFRGRLLEEGNGITLLIAPQSYVQAAETPNQKQVAGALNGFILATKGDRQKVSIALDKLTAGQFPAAFDAIGPGFYENLGIIAIEQVNAQNQFLSQRLSSARFGERGFQSTGIESPLNYDKDGKSVLDAKSVLSGKDGKRGISQSDDMMSHAADNKWGVWVQGNGIFGKISNISQVPSSRFESGGFLAGIDYRWAEHFTTGIFGGYQGLYSKSANGAATNINTALYGVYTTYQNGGFYSDAILTGGHSGYTMRRPIQFGTIDRTAKSSPDGNQFSAYLDLGYDWTVGNFTFGPIISGQYTYVGIAPFSEVGADSLNLAVNQQNVNSLRSGLGGRIAYTWKVTAGITLIPEARMIWQHEFLENSRNIGASLDGGNASGFGYQTSDPDRDSVFAGAGVSALFGQRWSANVFYNADFGRQDYVAQMVSAGLGWKF